LIFFQETFQGIKNFTVGSLEIFVHCQDDIFSPWQWFDKKRIVSALAHHHGFAFGGLDKMLHVALQIPKQFILIADAVIGGDCADHGKHQNAKC
jgi:hypothetical protein